MYSALESWDVQQCVFCSSINYINIVDKRLAWECWNCTAKHWIDDESQLQYAMQHQLNIFEANFDLVSDLVEFNHGLSERI